MINKHIKDKLRTDLIEPLWLEELAKTLTYGSIEYGDRSYLDCDPNTLDGAIIRHHIEARKGNEFNIEVDKNGREHALRHYACIAINALFRLSQEYYKDDDDGFEEIKFKNEIPNGSFDLFCDKN